MRPTPRSYQQARTEFSFEANEVDPLQALGRRLRSAPLSKNAQHERMVQAPP